ncbi:hypothetical protein C1645_713603 [Glomus cerebriforme]|uniref:HCP-like protein n=1 Tax=Glomus cerebriforme TaxID=658196 RepID=A0A397SYV1_9GLOM|nr:hypothetical protein C1645_713603 [Glomus cerebriforme]
MKASQQNDINGHFEVGDCYDHGDCIKENPKKAFEFYQLASNNGLNIALNQLAFCYNYGYGIKRDVYKAFELYKKSSDNGFIPSQRGLAWCYEYGEGTQRNKREALKWYKLFQENDGDFDVSSEIKLIEKELAKHNILDEIIQAYLKYHNLGFTKSFDFHKFLDKYKLKSREIFYYFINNSSIQHYKGIVGNFYYKGFGIDKNNDKAFEWYIKASQQNDINGYFQVGWCYHYGYGIKKNHKKAFKFYQLAANNESNIATYFLANFYEYGYGIQKDNLKAFELYKKSAENGFIPSQYFLAICYEYGLDAQLQVNKREALKWYKLYQENDGIYKVMDKIKNIKESEQEE